MIDEGLKEPTTGLRMSRTDQSESFRVRMVLKFVRNHKIIKNHEMGMKSSVLI